MAFPPAPSGVETKRPTTALCRRVKCPDLVEPGGLALQGGGGCCGSRMYRSRYALCRVTNRIPGNMSVCPQGLIPLHREVVR